jgi:NAD(P)-dependent dehydrogenase (short-subunit alcohol dehydrogenase family)
VNAEGPQRTGGNGRSLEGRVAIVTGASRGIGATTAEVFADRGATVVLAARDEQALVGVAESIEGDVGRALVVPTDLNDAPSVERLVESALEEFGHLDAAVNNAGGGHPPVPLADLDPEEFDRIVGVNLRGVFLSMKYEIPAMLEAGGGRSSTCRLPLAFEAGTGSAHTSPPNTE